MFKNWGAWLGIELENGQAKEGEESAAKEKGGNGDINKPSAGAGGEQITSVQEDQLLQQAKGLSGYIYNFASTASKKLSESVAETAQNLKKSVEEGKINGIIDKTILGDFQKEQQRFVEEKKAKQSGPAVPPWVGYNDEDTVQQQILALSADKRNFLRDPPAGVHFHFDWEQMYPVAMVMLEEDELLQKMRFHLVPKQVKEEAFWKNYFYRVSLINQSAQLTALAAQQAAECSEEKGAAGGPQVHHPQGDAVPQKSPSSLHSTKPNSNKEEEEEDEEEEVSTSPSEFASDAFDSCGINEDDVRKEMEQLVLERKERRGTDQEETPDWERELQEELQEYDVVEDDAESRNANWDKEIEEMLKADS